MPRMLRFEQLDPYATFAASIRASRYGMRTAYEQAWYASDRCNELLKTALHEQIGEADAFELAGFPSLREPRADIESPDRMWSEAYAHDLHADNQAGAVLFFADDVLQRFAKRVLDLKSAPGIKMAVGRKYGGVPLTALLKAATNAIRHASERDDELALPYPAPDERSRRQRQQFESIEVLQQALGVGLYEPIREAHSWKVLSLIDGQYGTADPDYHRIESAIVDAANTIATSAGSPAERQLRSALEERR